MNWHTFLYIIIIFSLNGFVNVSRTCSVGCSPEVADYYFGRTESSSNCLTFKETGNDISNHVLADYISTMPVCVASGRRTWCPGKDGRHICGAVKTRLEKCGSILQFIANQDSITINTFSKLMYGEMIWIMEVKSKLCYFSSIRNCENCQFINVNLFLLQSKCIQAVVALVGENISYFVKNLPQKQYIALQIIILDMNVFGLTDVIKFTIYCPEMPSIFLSKIENKLSAERTINIMFDDDSCGNVIYIIVILNLVNNNVEQNFVSTGKKVSVTGLDLNMLYRISVTAIRKEKNNIENKASTNQRFYTGVETISLIKTPTVEFSSPQLIIPWSVKSIFENLVFAYIIRLDAITGCFSVHLFLCEDCPPEYPEKFFTNENKKEYYKLLSCPYIPLVTSRFLLNNTDFLEYLTTYGIYNVTLLLYGINMAGITLIYDSGPLVSANMPGVKVGTIIGILLSSIVISSCSTCLICYILKKRTTVFNKYNAVRPYNFVEPEFVKKLTNPVHVVKSPDQPLKFKRVYTKESSDDSNLPKKTGKKPKLLTSVTRRPSRILKPPINPFHVNMAPGAKSRLFPKSKPPKSFKREMQETIQEQMMTDTINPVIMDKYVDPNLYAIAHSAVQLDYTLSKNRSKSIHGLSPEFHSPDEPHPLEETKSSSLPKNRSKSIHGLSPEYRSPDGPHPLEETKSSTFLQKL